MRIESTRTFAVDGGGGVARPDAAAVWLAATGVDDGSAVVVLPEAAAALLGDESVEGDPLGAAWCGATCAGFVS